MNDLFVLQYRMMQQARTIVFDFLDTTVRADISLPVAAHNNQSAANLLQHVAACYINWLACFAMNLPATDIPGAGSVADLRGLYQKVDDTVVLFLEKYKDQMNSTLTGIHNQCGKVTATPAQLFTHVLTHEFHHKGQLVNLCRGLGHTPPETDVSLFFS